MTTHVALIDPVVCDARSILERKVSETVEFHPIPDPTDEQRAQSVLKRVHVVVGDWPDVDSAPEVRLVQQTGAGVEGYDRKALPPRAYLCNVYGHATGVAEHVFALMFALHRRLLTLDDDLRRGRWPDYDAKGAVKELGGLTMGVVGFGRIGQALVDPANVFGLDVVAMRSREPTGPSPDGVKFVGGPNDLDRLLRDSDVVTLSLPLTNETEGLVGDAELELLGPGGYLVNVARGPIVDEQALYEALDRGKIAGAGIDTWYRYPDDWDEQCRPSNYPFHELDNVVMSPHIAGWTDRTTAHRWEFIARNIDRIARGERPENVVLEPRTE